VTAHRFDIPRLRAAFPRRHSSPREISPRRFTQPQAGPRPFFVLGTRGLRWPSAAESATARGATRLRAPCSASPVDGRDCPVARRALVMGAAAWCSLATALYMKRSQTPRSDLNRCVFRARVASLCVRRTSLVAPWTREPRRHATLAPARHRTHPGDRPSRTCFSETFRAPAHHNLVGVRIDHPSRRRAR